MLKGLREGSAPDNPLWVEADTLAGIKRVFGRNVCFHHGIVYPIDGEDIVIDNPYGRMSVAEEVASDAKRLILRRQREVDGVLQFVDVPDEEIILTIGGQPITAAEFRQKAETREFEKGAPYKFWSWGTIFERRHGIDDGGRHP